MACKYSATLRLPVPSAGVQVYSFGLLFNKWRNNLIFTPRDRNGCETIGLIPSYDSLLDIVLSCEGSAPPQRISHVVLDSVKLRDDPNNRILLQTPPGLSCGVAVLSVMLEMEHIATVHPFMCVTCRARLLCATESPRGKGAIRWIHDLDLRWHPVSLQACLQTLNKSGQCASVALFFGVCVRVVCRPHDVSCLCSDPEVSAAPTKDGRKIDSSLTSLYQRPCRRSSGLESGCFNCQWVTKCSGLKEI